MNNTLEIKNLYCYRNNTLIFKNINISLTSGDILILEGLNGSGKSTLINCINGLLVNSFSSKTFKWNDKKVEDNLSWKWYQNKILYIDTNNPMNTNLTVRENLNYWKDLYGSDNFTEESLELFGIRHLIDLPMNLLSVGQKKRVSLSRTIIHDRPLWLLDEPTLGLDYKSLEILENLIMQHTFDGGIAIIATHTHLNFKNVLKLYL